MVQLNPSSASPDHETLQYTKTPPRKAPEVLIPIRFGLDVMVLHEKATERVPTVPTVPTCSYLLGVRFPHFPPKAYNFRRTQKRRYRGALDALRLAVEVGGAQRALLVKPPPSLGFDITSQILTAIYGPKVNSLLLSPIRCQYLLT